MGAGYHTIHHTSYKHNYGHYTIFMDQFFGTMLTPEEDGWGVSETEEQVKGAGEVSKSVSPAGSVSDLQEVSESRNAAKVVKAQ